MEQKNIAAVAFDLTKCFADAANIYAKNIPLLLLATVLLSVLSFVSLLILAGPLYGGYCLMLINAMRREEKTVNINDMFAIFHKFWPLCGLAVVQGLGLFLGFLVLVIPGIIIMTMWFYVYFIMVDKNQGVMSSLKSSWDMVKQKGFWLNCTLCLIYLILNVIPTQIPAIGWVATIFIMPFAMLVVTSAYLQQSKA